MTSSLKSTVFNKQLPLNLLAGLLISTASIYAPMAHAAAIYKVIDAQTGQITFTDSPEKYEQQADKQISQIAITTGNSSANTTTNNPTDRATNTAANPAVNSQATPPPAVKPKPMIHYQLTMTEPSEERAYRRPAQSIDVALQIKPALQADDNVSIYLDGTEVAQGLKASIATVDILPGEHSIQAVITAQDGKTLQQVSRTVYVIQNTQTLQNKKKLAAQMLAYQRLPWHQKMLIKMRQKEASPPPVKAAN